MVAKGECLTPPLHEFVYLKFSEAVAVVTFPLVFPSKAYQTITGRHQPCFASAFYTLTAAAVRGRHDPLGWVDTFPSFSRKSVKFEGVGVYSFSPASRHSALNPVLLQSSSVSGCIVAT